MKRIDVLGLAYGTVSLMPHDARWHNAFLAERALLKMHLDGIECEIEHIGSTAVPGLPAKPILDLAVGILLQSQQDECLSRISKCGYLYRGDAGAEGGHVFVRTTDNVRTHHLHVVPLHDPQWSNYLRFRDLLTSNPDSRERYAAIKQVLAAQFPSDRPSYTEAKQPVILSILGKQNDWNA